MITVKQAQETLSTEDTAALAAAEGRIDAALAKWDGTRATVDLNGLNLRRPMMDKLCLLYRVGGWSIEIKHGDQRGPGHYAEIQVGK